MLYCLSRSADVQDAVYRETATVLADSKGHVTPDSLQRLHYIRACVKETFRCTGSMLSEKILVFFIKCTDLFSKYSFAVADGLQ